MKAQTSKKLKSSILPLLATPMVFSSSAESIYSNIHKNDVTALLGAILSSVFFIFLILKWQKHFAENSIFKISDSIFEGVKRTSFLIGLILSAPLGYFIFEQLSLPRYSSNFPYIIIFLGLSSLSFIVLATLTSSVFWCIEGFKGANK